MTSARHDTQQGITHLNSMKLKSIVDQLQHEMKVMRGEATKARVYTSDRTFPDEGAAQTAFAIVRSQTAAGEWLVGTLQFVGRF